MLRSLTCLFVFFWPALAVAHPHIFVNAGLRLVVSGDGEVEAVEVSWVYDEFYSLLILEDKGLDPDYDGVLTEAELRQLDGFDLQWIDGFAGDLFARRDGADVPLGPPEGLGTSVEDGKIVTRHRRALNGPAEGLELRVFDPTYYTAYDLEGGVEVAGPCQPVLDPADLEAAHNLVASLIRGMNAAQLDMDFPAVGEHFADRITIECSL